MLVGFQLQLLQEAVNYFLLSGVNRLIVDLHFRALYRAMRNTCLFNVYDTKEIIDAIHVIRYDVNFCILLCIVFQQKHFLNILHLYYYYYRHCQYRFRRIFLAQFVFRLFKNPNPKSLPSNKIVARNLTMAVTFKNARSGHDTSPLYAAMAIIKNKIIAIRSLANRIIKIHFIKSKQVFEHF